MTLAVAVASGMVVVFYVLVLASAVQLLGQEQPASGLAPQPAIAVQAVLVSLGCVLAAGALTRHARAQHRRAAAPPRPSHRSGQDQDIR